MSQEDEISRRSFLSRSAVVGGAAVLGGGAAAGLAGCSNSSGGSSSSTAATSSGQPVKGGTLTVGTLDEINGFYPPSDHWDTSGFLYANAIYDPLVAVGSDGSFQPYLCQSISPNGTFDVWTMTLRPGVTFHDGSPLTSAVVLANYQALQASLLTGQALAQVASVTAPDSMTVVYTLNAPNPTFPLSLTSQLGYVVGQAMVDAAKAGQAAPKPIGTGPFMYSQWQPNQFFTAVKNPSYWRKGLPYLDQITFKPIPDTTQREATLKTGGVDMIESTDPNTINRFHDVSGYLVNDTRTGTIGEPTVSFIMLNCATAPTNDLSIRQALAMAMDQATIQKIFGGGFAQPLNGLFLKGSEYYSETAYPAYNPAKAKELVAAYKAAHGTPSIELTTITDPRLAQLVQIIQQMWNSVGFNVTINTIQQAQLVDTFVTGTFQAATSYQFGNVTPDLNYVWWSTTTVKPVGSIALNFPRNSDPVIESNMLQARSTTDPSVRVSSYQTVNEQLNKDLPYLWIERYLFIQVTTDRVQGTTTFTLPNGKEGYPYDEGIFFPTEIWLKS